jgi:hypothetical protein
VLSLIVLVYVSSFTITILLTGWALMVWLNFK